MIMYVFQNKSTDGTQGNLNWIMFLSQSKANMPKREKQKQHHIAAGQQRRQRSRAERCGKNKWEAHDWLIPPAANPPQTKSILSIPINDSKFMAKLFYDSMGNVNGPQ